MLEWKSRTANKAYQTGSDYQTPEQLFFQHPAMPLTRHHSATACDTKHTDGE